jgi:putative acetyltransferase
LKIFPEVAADFDAIADLLERAFGRSQEARLVEALRKTGRLAVSLAGFDRQGILAGYAALSTVSVGAHSGRALGLGPVAVLPGKQGKGFGAALIKTGLRAGREAGFGAVFVLGDPKFYGKFGFARADGSGIACEYGASKENFLALELMPDALKEMSGTVRYAPEFATCV